MPDSCWIFVVALITLPVVLILVMSMSVVDLPLDATAVVSVSSISVRVSSKSPEPSVKQTKLIRLSILCQSKFNNDSICLKTLDFIYSNTNESAFE